MAEKKIPANCKADFLLRIIKEEDILGETHSKFYWIKIVVEKLLEKLDKSQTLNNNITGKEDFSCPDCKKDKN